MVASIDRIEKDLAALEAAIVAIAQEFHKTYASYLEALGKTTRQQLILASYYLCTQAYPRHFLHLSLSHRQELQQTLRDLGTQTQQELLAKLIPPLAHQQPDAVAGAEAATSPELITTELNPIVESPIANSPEIESTDTATAAIEFSETERFSPAPEISQGNFFATTNPSAGMNLGEAFFQARPHAKPNPLEELLLWQETLERAIGEELRSLSHAVNRLFQQTGILPKKLPEPILEAAIRAEATEMVGGPPNLLNLMIETVGDSPKHPSDDKDEDEDEDEDGSSLMRVTTVHLRLSDIEFADSTTMAWRTRLRSLAARLKTLARDYRKKQQERTIAEAEAAWRSVWVDE
ncbi:MAG: hypothetical protein KME16_06605 [Scytolyngbya sp. HA4215-MV1]|jgi:hypothetical protein|nr:hypothetical protein [Scytolyngbya sp. HA4215-MV1]